MGVLDWLRGKPRDNFSRNLPVPSTVRVDRHDASSDIPPIRAESREIKPIEEEHNPVIILDETHDLPPPPVVNRRDNSSDESDHKGEEPKHLFVASDEYSAIIEKTNTVRSKLLSSEEAIQKLLQLRAAEDEQLTQWQESLEGLEKKISYVENVIAKSGGV